MVSLLRAAVLALLLLTSAFAQVLQPGNGGTGTSTPPSSAQLPIGDGTGVYAPQTLSGDCTISTSGVMTCSSSSVGGSCDVVLNTASDICSQINTAVTALGAGGGRICLPASTSLSCGTTATVNKRSISILGSGVKSTIINCTVAGDCLVLAPPLFDTTTTGDAVGGTVSDFSILGSTAANQVLLHTKDMIGWSLHDLFFDTPSASGMCLQMENVTAWTERNIVQSQFGYRCAQAVNMTNDAGNSFQPGSFGYNYFDFAMSPATGNFGLYTAGSAQLYNGYLHMTVNGRGGTAVYMRGFSTGPVSTPNQRFFLNTEGSGTLFNVVPAGGKLQFVGLASIQGGGMSQGTAYYDDFYFTSPWDNSYLNSNAWNQSFAALSGINNDTGSSYALTVTGRCPGRTTGTCNFFIGTAITSGNGAQMVFYPGTTPKKGALNIYGGSADALQWDSSGNAYLPTLLSAGGLGTDSSGKIISTAGGASGTVTYTTSHTASSSDNGLIVVMNCASACTFTLPATQPSTSWRAWVTRTNTNATIVLGGSNTFNGSTSVPVLIPFKPMLVSANTATATDYIGDAPLVAGTNVTFTAASNGVTIASTGGGGGGGFYQTVQSNGTDQTQEAKLNFSSKFTVADDGANSRTNVDIPDATNSTKGLMKGDGTSITCTSGTCSTVGGGGSLPSWLAKSPDAPPSSANAMDDEFNDATGMSGPVNGLAAKWTALNTPSYTFGFDRILLDVATNGSSDNFRYICQTAPSTPWEVEIKISAVWDNLAGFPGAGLIIRDSGTGKFTTDFMGWRTSSFSLSSFNYNNNTTYAGSGTGTIAATMSYVYYMKMKDDGTNLTFSIGADGSQFVNPGYTIARTSFLANPNQICVGYDGNSSAGKVSIDFFRRTL